MENNIICHRRNSLFGKEREDHKYVARVFIKRTIRGNQYRYFYDKKEYQNYLQQQQANRLKPQIPAKNFTNTGKIEPKLLKDKKPELTEKKFTTGKIEPKVVADKKPTLDLVKKGETAVNKNLNKPVESLILPYSAIKEVATFVAALAKTAIDKIDDLVYTKKEQEADERKKQEEERKRKEAFDQYRKEEERREQEKAQKNDGRIERDSDSGRKFAPKQLSDLDVTLPDGSMKRFDNVDEYEDYKERLDYQQNEPDFMKNVPEISDNDVFTKMEDQEKVNEKYSPYDETTSQNCSNCSIAYELRRRGYDVEAVDNGGMESYDGNTARHYDFYEDAKVIGIYGDGSTITHTEEWMRDAYREGDGRVHIDSEHDKKEYDFSANEYSYTAESLEKGILANSPPGSRGMIDVCWNLGGAHSIVYEVDVNGKVTIRDSQTYDEYDLSELASKVSQVRICRTDNLQLKEDILKTVRPNTNKERDYYVDKWELYRYDDR